MVPDFFESVYRCLMQTDPQAKCREVPRLRSLLTPEAVTRGRNEVVEPAEIPGRPARPELVDPQKVPRRRLGSLRGRAALVHAIAHIEFNAINLALDAAYRFRDMPLAYYEDWISVAVDEARHFQMLRGRLRAMNFDYGDFPAHNGLWQMALKTTYSCGARMALVPRVLEARGLDVTPAMMERLAAAGDDETVAVLEVILSEEVRHVAIGTHWFRHCCTQEGSNPLQTFMDLLAQHYAGTLKGPFNLRARYRAGFTKEEMNALTEGL